MKLLPSMAALSAAMLTVGCASLGGNIKGSFQCQAPGGICAPTSKIDDQALAILNGDDGVSQGGSTLMKAAAPQVHSERALKVVLPARADRFGRWRDTSVVYVEPDAPAGHQALPPSAPTAAPRLSLVDLASGAPDLNAFDQTVTGGDRPAAAVNPAPAIKRQVQQVLARPAASAGGIAANPIVPPAPAPETPKPGPATQSQALHAPAFPSVEGEGDR